MPLKTLVEAAKSALKGVVGREPHDPLADRVHVLQDIHLAEKAWASDDPHPWFSLDGEHVAFTPVMRGGAPLTIGGQTTTFISANRFADYLQAMRCAVEQGAADGEIASGLQGSTAGGVTELAPPPARDGTSADIRRTQQVAGLAQEGRNPDGSLKAIFGDHAGDG